MDQFRHYSLFDRLCMAFDHGLHTLSGHAESTGIANPAEHIPKPELNPTERHHAAALMRVNHAGEICAQALYHGQALSSSSAAVRAQMHEAAKEEGDHLMWCQSRITELGSHTSYLNPLWYSGSFCIGMVAGAVGDAWSLGFIAETEWQVIKHLQSHLQALPVNDKRSAEILRKMELDEAKHREQAMQAGAHELPYLVKKIMGLVSKVMVKTAYWV